MWPRYTCGLARWTSINTDSDSVEVVTLAAGPNSVFGPELNGHGMYRSGWLWVDGACP